MAPSKAASIAPTRLLPLEFRVWRRLQTVSLEPGRWLVACSGGLDSIVLVECLARLAPRLALDLEVVSLHHGRSDRWAGAREKAFAVARTAARARGLRFHGIRRDGRLRELRSEADLRDYRHRAIRELAADRKASGVFFAHHADDLLETRLIRLIRGTGPSGLRSMTLLQDGVVRPFLEETRAELEVYAHRRALTWFEDPSNRDHQPLRNWLRRQWLPELEKKRPGAGRAFARSLQSVVESLEAEAGAFKLSNDVQEAHRLGLESYQRMSRSNQRSELARLLRFSGVREFSVAHLDELRKRLAGRSRRFLFLGRHWAVNAGQITVAETLSEALSDLSGGDAT